ncbi:MAG TPA: M20/M25/M40 family metallo-hydrolase [bacterium]|nr:M20/M25/M40 family metallo-hydrolase [bacterium]
MNLINNDDLKFLKQLIRVESTAARPDDLFLVLQMVWDYFKASGAKAALEKIYEKNGKYSLVLSNNNDLKQDVILLGHLDVAEGEGGFAPHLEGDWLYGRGAGDMKGPSLALLRIFITALQENFDLNIALILTTDEELGGENGSNYIVNELGYRAKVVFVPNNGKNINTICVQEKGFLQCRVRAQGKAAHGARPWKGENAVLKLLEFYYQLAKFYPQPKDDNQWKKSINLGYIKGGSALNSVPETAEIGLDIRFTEKEDRQELAEQLQGLANDYDLEVEILSGGDVVEIPEDDLYLLRLAEIIEEYTKKPVDFIPSSMASDARFFTSHGVSALCFRPETKHLHAADESLKIASLEDYAFIVYQFLKNFKNIT